MILFMPWYTGFGLGLGLGLAGCGLGIRLGVCGLVNIPEFSIHLQIEQQT